MEHFDEDDMPATQEDPISLAAAAHGVAREVQQLQGAVRAQQRGDLRHPRAEQVVLEVHGRQRGVELQGGAHLV